jgi:hypothetical protein
MSRPVQLQFNSSGAWRSGPDFDAGEVPPEFFEASDQMARLTGSHLRMRIVMCIPNGSGGHQATRDPLMQWSRETGWVKS